MADSTTYPHEDLITENKVVITELPQKAQNLLTKFKAETDEDKKDAMDVTLYGMIEDHIEAKQEADKAEKTKAKVDEKKKSKLDVSAADTATGKDGKTKGDKKDDTTKNDAPKNRSSLSVIFGRK